MGPAPDDGQELVERAVDPDGVRHVVRVVWSVDVGWSTALALVLPDKVPAPLRRLVARVGRRKPLTSTRDAGIMVCRLHEGGAPEFFAIGGDRNWDRAVARAQTIAEQIRAGTYTLT